MRAITIPQAITLTAALQALVCMMAKWCILLPLTYFLFLLPDYIYCFIFFYSGYSWYNKLAIRSPL